MIITSFGVRCRISFTWVEGVHYLVCSMVDRVLHITRDSSSGQLEWIRVIAFFSSFFFSFFLLAEPQDKGMYGL